MMNKKDLKMYEAPACEVVELNVKANLMAGSPIQSETESTEEEGWG